MLLLSDDDDEAVYDKFMMAGRPCKLKEVGQVGKGGPRKVLSLSILKFISAI